MRNPKELKDLIEKCKNEEGQLIDNAWKRIEKSQIDLLNARLEEQTNNMNFYKSRGDDFMKRIKNLEKTNLELTDRKEYLAERYDSLNNTNNALNQQITALNEDNQKLICINNEFKQQIEDLTRKNESLNSSLDSLKKQAVQEKQNYEEKIQGKIVLNKIGI